MATLYGSDGRDVFVGTDRFGKLRGRIRNFYNRAVSFGQLHVYGGDEPRRGHAARRGSRKGRHPAGRHDAGSLALRVRANSPAIG